MSSEDRITLAGASFGYAGKPVVAGVDLSIGPGTFLGVLGPNGSGKSTLLRGILGLLSPLAGTVHHGDSTLGYVPQRESLDSVYPLTVEEVVEMGAYARLKGWRSLSREERQATGESLALVGLEHRRRDLFSSLSGGQRQRVLIARALLARPDVLLLDEPTSGVDQPTREAVFDLLVDLNQNEDLAIVLVSHQLEMVRAVREVVWVDEGRARLGSPDEMLTTEALHELFAGKAPHAGAVGNGGKLGKADKVRGER